MILSIKEISKITGVKTSILHYHLRKSMLKPLSKSPVRLSAKDAISLAAKTKSVSAVRRLMIYIN